MSITEKVSEKKEDIEELAEEPKKLSKEEKERLIKEEVGKSQYYETIGMI